MMSGEILAMEAGERRKVKKIYMNELCRWGEGMNKKCFGQNTMY